MTAGFDDLRQTKEWGDYLFLLGWKVIELKTKNEKLKTFLHLKKIPLLPISIAKLQRPHFAMNSFEGRAFWAEVKRLCRKHRVVVLYYEPSMMIQDSHSTSSVQAGFTIDEYEKELKEQGFTKTKSSYLPRRTIWLDLAKSKKSLLAEMKAKARYNIGLARRNNLLVRVVDGKKLLQSPLLYRSFVALLRENAKRLKIFGMPEKWLAVQIKAFGEKCFVTLAFSGEKLEAGNFFMESRNACFHSHNGSTEMGRKLMAPTACAWEGIQESKRRKLKTFDFDGIDDGSKSLKRWRGFSRFKKGFGGRETEFVGQFYKLMFPI